MRWCGERHNRTFADYDELWRWSVNELEAFWAIDLGVLRGPARAGRTTRVLARPRDARCAMVPRRRAELRRARAAPARRGPGSRSCIASETAATGEMTWRRSARPRWPGSPRGLRALGVRRGRPRRRRTCPTSRRRSSPSSPRQPRGDLVELPPRSSAPAASSTASPDRADGAPRRGRLPLRRARLRPARGDRRDPQRAADRPAHRPRGMLHDDVGPGGSLARAASVGRAARARRGRGAHFEPVPFDHPLWVLYSSGTTGLPKAIVHGHGGVLLEQLKRAACTSTSGPGTGCSGSRRRAG